MRAIALLLYFQMRNSARLIVTDPRKFVPALLVAAAYVYCSVFGSQLERIVRTAGYHDFGGLLLDCRAGVIYSLALFAVAVIGTGFAATYLAFSAPDIDYLMPSPVTRRSLLTMKLLKVSAGSIGYSVFLWLAFRILITPLFPTHEVRWYTTLLCQTSLFFCIAGCMQIGLALSAHVGKRPLLYTLATAVLLCMIAGVVVGLARLGPAGLVGVLNSPDMAWIAFPCRWAADAMLLPLVGQSNLRPAALSLAFYAVSLLTVYGRNARFYETAYYVTLHLEQLRHAPARTPAVQFAERYDRAAMSRHGAVDGVAIYTIPAFGSGATAIFWANLACAAKRPWLNFVAPICAGVMLSAVALSQPQSMAGLAALTTVLVVVYLVTCGLSAFAPIASRYPIEGPLPIAPWKKACADILPFAIICCLPIWTLAAMLALGGGPNSSGLSLMLATVVPVAIAGLAATPYIVLTSLSHSAQDTIAQYLAICVLYLTVPLVSILYVPLVIAQTNANIAPSLIVIASLPGCLLITGLMFALAGRCCANLAATSEPQSLVAAIRNLPKLARRVPDADEALWLYVLALAASYFVRLALVHRGESDFQIALEIALAGLIAVFAWIGRWQLRSVWSWRFPAPTAWIGSILIGLGTVPWILALAVFEQSLQHGGKFGDMLGLDSFASLPSTATPRVPLLVGASSAVIQELVFRGSIQSALIRRVGIRFAIPVTALLFAVWNCDVSAWIWRAAVGLLLGWIVWRSHSIMPAILAHASAYFGLVGYFWFMLHARAFGALDLAAGAAMTANQTAIALSVGLGAILAGVWIVAGRPKAAAGRDQNQPDTAVGTA